MICLGSVAVSFPGHYQLEDTVKYIELCRVFQQCGILTCVDSYEPVQPFLSVETPVDGQ